MVICWRAKLLSVCSGTAFGNSPEGVGLSPELYLEYPDKVGLVNTVGTPVPPGTYGTVPTRERNLLAHPTLDMYLPLSKFESII